jgi:hypothetical protein
LISSLRATILVAACFSLPTAFRGGVPHPLLWLRPCSFVLHLFDFFSAHDDFGGGTLQLANRLLRRQVGCGHAAFVGQAILPAAAFEAASWNRQFVCGFAAMRGSASKK